MVTSLNNMSNELLTSSFQICLHPFSPFNIVHSFPPVLIVEFPFLAFVWRKLVISCCCWLLNCALCKNMSIDLLTSTFQSCLHLFLFLFDKSVPLNLLDFQCSTPKDTDEQDSCRLIGRQDVRQKWNKWNTRCPLIAAHYQSVEWMYGSMRRHLAREDKEKRTRTADLKHMTLAGSLHVRCQLNTKQRWYL